MGSNIHSKPLIKYVVNVTNTGKIDADDVVLGFLVPPGAGKNGVPLQTLFGFKRIHVKAGHTVSVWLYPSLLDFTTVNINGQRSVHPGDYAISFGVAATAVYGQGFAENKMITI